jgi:hypothetical protein
MVKQQYEPGPPMDLANMRRRAPPHRLLPQRLLPPPGRDRCIELSRRHVGLWFQGRVKSGKCGRRGRWIDVLPNWKEKPGMPDNWRGRPAG